MFYKIKMLETKDCFKKNSVYTARFFDNYFNNYLMIAIQYGVTESGLPLYKSYYAHEIKFIELSKSM